MNDDLIKQRQADRERYPDPAFNTWLDEIVADGGITVWHTLDDVHGAHAAWCARPSYQARTPEVSVPCQCGARQANECKGAREPGCDLGRNEAHVRVAPKAAVDALKATLGAPVEKAAPSAWLRAEAIVDLPAVHEAITALLDDNTGDNATALIAAVLEAQQAAQPVAELVALELERLAQDPPISGNALAQTRVMMAAANVRQFGLDGGATTAQPVAGEPAPVGLVPLTDEQIKAGHAVEGLTKYLETFTAGARFAERHHSGIKAGKDGAS